ncbi:MAG: alpha/beta hydrolase fold domain-containing protein [Asticcacaulis sp.]
MRISLFNSWLLKKGLRLPTALLRFFAGGGVVYSGGRTLDAQIQFLWRFMFSRTPGRTGLGLTGKSLESARQEWQDAAALFGLPSDIRVRIEPAPADAPTGGLVIRPRTMADDAPLLVFFHQGGGVLGGPDLSKAFCALLAHTARCPVYLPEYRLAPLNRFPAALDDARLAFDWAQANTARLGASSGRVSLGGALMGGNMALRLSLDLKRDFKPLPAGLLLITPLLDLSDPHIKTDAAQGLWPLTSEDIGQMIAHYAGAGTGLADPRLSPALETLIIGQPPVFVVSAGLDPLAAQGEAFVKRLLSARIQTVYRRYDPLPLGFDLLVSVVDEARAATVDIAKNWQAILRGVHKSQLPDMGLSAGKEVA